MKKGYNSYEFGKSHIQWNTCVWFFSTNIALVLSLWCIFSKLSSRFP